MAISLTSILSFFVESINELEALSSYPGAGEVRAGLQRVHDARHEPAPRAEPDETHHPEGDREDGSDRAQEVPLDPGAAEAEHLRSRHDPSVGAIRLERLTLGSQQ